MDGLTLVLRSRRAQVLARGRQDECEALIAAIAADTGPTMEAFAATAAKLKLADAHIVALAAALDRETPPSQLARELDLNAFRVSIPQGLDFLKRQFDTAVAKLQASIPWKRSGVHDEVRIPNDERNPKENPKSKFRMTRPAKSAYGA